LPLVSVLSNIALSAGIGALGFSAGGFGLTATGPDPTPFSAPAPAGAASDAGPSAPLLEAVWPAVFGTVPPPPPEPEPEPVILVEPEPEPEIRYDYQLTGLVADEYAGWAMISLGGLQQVVRVGDELEGGEIVTRIDNRGVWVTWRDLPQLIPVYKPDTSAMARDLTAEADAAPARDLGEVSVVLERLDRRALEETFYDAGNLVLTDQANGSKALDVVWIRQGALYDRIGLRTGDKIIRINGEIVDNLDLLAYVPDTITNGGSIDLEILRDGTRQIIKVNLGQG